MDNFESDFEKAHKRFNTVFKVAIAFIACVFCLVVAGWFLIGYVVVTKGPETVQRIERIGDAYADKLEQENKKSE
jgi:hypothetical protein